MKKRKKKTLNKSLLSIQYLLFSQVSHYKFHKITQSHLNKYFKKKTIYNIIIACTQVIYLFIFKFNLMGKFG